MRRSARVLGLLLIVAGVATLGWAAAVWRWEDPFTSLYAAHQQRGLAAGLDERFAAYSSNAGEELDRAALAAEARRYRASGSRGDPVGRIVVPRLGLDAVFVHGTDHDSLERGPGLDSRTFYPGQGRLVYIAGHRTTFGAPFSRIDRLRRGDPIRLELPYGTFVYEVTGSRVVAASDVSVLRSKRVEQVALQACHPRFFASHRWITYGRLVRVETPAGDAALS
jgi:sortase A